jgi:hypothetical protein
VVSTTVPLPSVHVQCVVGLTTTFQTDGLGVEVRLPGLHVLLICSPDLYLWESMKEKVCATEVRDREHLISRSEVAATDIVSVKSSIRRRCEACVQAEGGHLEHLL